MTSDLRARAQHISQILEGELSVEEIEAGLQAADTADELGLAPPQHRAAAKNKMMLGQKYTRQWEIDRARRAAYSGLIGGPEDGQAQRARLRKMARGERRAELDAFLDPSRAAAYAGFVGGPPQETK